MIAADALLAAATFAKPHGVKGEISVAVAPDDMDFVEDATFVFVGLDGLMVPFAVQAVRPTGAETLLLTLKGIDSDTKAARLTGKTLWLERATLAGDDDGDDADSEGFYLDDLIGFTVIAGGAPVGEITDYDDSTDNVLFILRRPDGSEALIPASDDFIDSVDTQERTIAMTLPEGLLAL